MKRKTNLKLLVGILIVICLITLNSKIVNASIEIIPSKAGTGKDAIVNTTISNSYLLCQQMKESGQALGRTSVVPHLATNLDWGAVSYLSNSSYGTNTEGGNTGVQITINNVKYYSTNGNLTGVMNWGTNPNRKLYTQTSGITQKYNPDSISTSVQIIYNNKDTRFVDSASGNGVAVSETTKWYGASTYVGGNYNEYPVSIRGGLFGINISCGDSGSYMVGKYQYPSSGNALPDITFRPVVWNE